MTPPSQRDKIEMICGHDSCARKGTYSVRGECLNCGDEFELVITQGHEKPGSFLGASCPTCGCRKVAGYELLGRESDAPVDYEFQGQL